MSITTLSRVKTILKITGTEQDAVIEMLIPLVEETILNYRNRAFDTDSSGTVYPLEAEIIAIKIIGVQLRGDYEGISSYGLDDCSTSYETSADSVPIKVLLQDIRRHPVVI